MRAQLQQPMRFALFVTGDTFIPYHLQKGAQQPPAAHPNGLSLFAYKWTGEKGVAVGIGKHAARLTR